MGPCNYVLWKNIIIVIISIVALVSGAYVSILGMIEDFTEANHEHVHENVTFTQWRDKANTGVPQGYFVGPLIYMFAIVEKH